MVLTITLPDEIARAAEIEAQRTGRSLQDVLVEALLAHFAAGSRYGSIDAVVGAAGTLVSPGPWPAVRELARQERLAAKYGRG